MNLRFLWRPGRLLVLAYHNVGSTWRFPVHGNAARKLAVQLYALKRICNLVALEPAVRAVRQSEALPSRAVAITFDDGYRDNLTLGVPVLNRLDVPATVFLVPGFLSRRVDAWWERLAWGLACARRHDFNMDEGSFDLRSAAHRNAVLGMIEDRLKCLDHGARLEAVEELLDQVKPEGRYPAEELFLDWDGARELTGAGLAIGSHTMEHAILARESSACQQADLEESRRILQEELKSEVKSLAYPNGTVADYSDVTLSAAQSAGYEYAFTTTRALVAQDTPPFEVCRWVIDPEFSPARLTAAVIRHFTIAETSSGGELSKYPSGPPLGLS